VHRRTEYRLNRYAQARVIAGDLLSAVDEKMQMISADCGVASARERSQVVLRRRFDTVQLAAITAQSP